MSNSSAKTFILKNLSNIPGWRTKRHLLALESDDWGSIRTSSVAAVDRLCIKGIDFKSLDARRYSFNDSLATVEDLSALFEVLLSVKDSNNNPFIFTAVSLVANPDFLRIEENGFRQYYYEDFTETLKRYPGCEGSFEMWKQGIRERIFLPQFHGREHLNIPAWMHALKNGHTETMDVFKERMWGYVNSFYNGRKINYQEAFNIHDPAEIHFLENVIEDGLNIFEKLFGYRAKMFVAPNGIYSSLLEQRLSLNGIMYISKGRIQEEPLGYGKVRKTFQYLGMKNKWNQIYLTRNCFFEPGSPLRYDWIGSCISEIETAFRWHKPAIIGSHRVNYIGSLNIENRKHSLQMLHNLLNRIKKMWPDVEFISSDQLGSLILDSKS